MQINRGRMLQELVLPTRCLYQIRVTVTDADGDNSTERIKISPSLFVEHVLPFAFHDHQRAFVVEEDAGIQKLPTQAQHFFRGRPAMWLWLIIESREFRCLHQCPPVTVYPAARKSSANSVSIWTAASNGIGFKCS